MDIPVRVSINRKSPDGKNANGPYRDGKELHRRVTCPLDRDHKGPLPSPAPPPPLREPFILIHFYSGLVFTLHGLLLHNLQGLVYF